MKLYLLILPICFFASSCNSNQNNKSKQKISSPASNLPDSIVETDLSRATDFYKGFYISKNRPIGYQKIDSLVYSFDSIQIRLWNTGGLFPSFDLYIITKDHDKWKGFYYRMEAEYRYATGDSSLEYLHGPMPMEIKKAKKIIPKSGWVKFVDSLISLNIMTLPDMYEIPGMKIPWTDAQDVIVQVSTKNHFRFYHYTEPSHFSDKFWQADKMASIQSLFYMELLR